MTAKYGSGFMCNTIKQNKINAATILQALAANVVLLQGYFSRTCVNSCNNINTAMK